MGRQGQRVCAACTNNCLLFHQINQTSPTSFFKVIAKEEYLTTLYIPPAFSSTVSDLLNKKIILNDSSGQHWEVKVSEVNGSFAFEEGWNVFSLDHGLKVGYLLVFNYIKDLDFDVKIYDTSACEKLDFSKQRNQKKRSRGRSGSPVRDGMLVRPGPNALVVSGLHVPKMKSQHKEDDLVVPQNSKEGAQHMYISEHCEDPYYSTSLEFEQNHGVDGTMKIANGDSKVSNVDYGSYIYQNDAILCSKDTIFEVGMGAALDISELEMSGSNTSLGEADKSTYDRTSTLKLKENKENKAIMSNGEAQECQFAEGLESDQVAIPKKEHALHIGGFHDTKQEFNGIPNLLDAHIHNGEMKKVPGDIIPKLGGSMDKLNVTGEMSNKFKKELVTLDELGATGLPKEMMGELGHCSDTFNQDNESHFKTAATLFCVVPNDDGCLQLPACLPSIRKVKLFQQRKMVVVLRDPLRRLWPVFYHEEPQLKLLTHGWLDFSRANNIQPADECIFEAEAEPESKSKRILAVRINHK
ncbi:methyltransferase C9orf114 [Spatholobus suberectus]|nr:methyltransferase C9orf114 [Spatholobus suberectus]